MKKAFLSLAMLLSTMAVSAQKIVGDMNGDGSLNIADVTLLVDNILKGETKVDYEYVDLGLSVMWATANVGAAKPEDAGMRFAWGETASKTSYTWSNYFDTTDGGKTFSTFSKGATNLDGNHDAASAASNGSCRMPTKDEWKELYDKCSISSKFISGVRCYKFTGPNGNYITIPYVSNMDGTSTGSITFAYWSSSIDTSSPANAMLFNGSTCSAKPRYYGASVRGVKEIKDKVLISSITFVDEVIKAKPGESVTVKGYCLPWSANRTTVNWTSSDPDVAKVSNGVVTAVGDGTCTITAAVAEGGAKATCKVIVSSSDKTFTVNGVTFTMKKVEGGTFTMGATSEQVNSGYSTYSDEKPTHSVTLSDYYIGETEVTQALWKAVMNASPSSSYSWTSEYGVGDSYPAYYISYDECKTFISELNSLTGATFRMPTEAEWEYAARGGKESKGDVFSGSNTIGDVAWYSSNSSSKTHPVATKKPNELGIYDMSGNVLEWCSDWSGDYSSSAQTNPTGASSGSSRVIRGGSWYDSAGYCRVACRNGYSPSDRDNDVGLRLALQ